MNKYRLATDADEDLIGIWMYIAEDSFESADQVIDHLKAAFEMLARQPGAGRLRAEIRPWLRSFAVGRYIIFIALWQTRLKF